MRKSNGYLLYDGPSKIDGLPIIVIATGFTRGSINTKTGPGLIQTWILRKDRAPQDAARDGADESVCGQCPLRPNLAKITGGPKCYVKTHQAPRSVWDGFNRGIYPKVPPGIFLGRSVRFGAYGDPAAVPAKVWAQARREMVHNTGYTHQWRTAHRCHARYLMASVETGEQRDEAKAMGYRTFRTKRPGDAVLAGEIVCPASAEAGSRTTCDKCRLCGGADVKAKDIVINLH